MIPRKDIRTLIPEGKSVPGYTVPKSMVNVLCPILLEVLETHPTHLQKS